MKRLYGNTFAIKDLIRSKGGEMERGSKMLVCSDRAL